MKGREKGTNTSCPIPEMFPISLSDVRASEHTFCIVSTLQALKKHFGISVNASTIFFFKVILASAVSS